MTQRPPTYKYVALGTLTMDPCFLTPEAYAEASDTWLCRGCCTPKPGIRGLNVHLQEPPGDKPINFVMGCGVSLIYKPFLDAVPNIAVQQDLFLGDVFGPDGRSVDDWKTFRARRRVIIRGVEHAGSRTCDECGRDIYFAMGTKYLYPAPHDDASMFESDDGRLILLSELLPKAPLGKRWRKLDIDYLDVLKTPLDGLGELTNP